MLKIENSAQRRESARKIWAEIRAEREAEVCTNKLVTIEESEPERTVVVGGLGNSV